jgi:hypothetical protein
MILDNEHLKLVDTRGDVRMVWHGGKELERQCRKRPRPALSSHCGRRLLILLVGMQDCPQRDKERWAALTISLLIRALTCRPSRKLWSRVSLPHLGEHGGQLLPQDSGFFAEKTKPPLLFEHRALWRLQRTPATNGKKCQHCLFCLRSWDGCHFGRIFGRHAVQTSVSYVLCKPIRMRPS